MIMPRDTRPRGETSRLGAVLFAAGVFFAGYSAGTCAAAHGAAQLAARQQRQAMREVDVIRNAQAMRWASDRGPASVPPEKVARPAVPPAEKGGSLDDGWWGFGATGYEKDDTSFYANCTQGWNYLRGDCKIMQSFDIGIDEGTFQVDLWLNPTNTAPLLFKPFYAGAHGAWSAGYWAKTWVLYPLPDLKLPSSIDSPQHQLCAFSGMFC